MTIGSDVMAQHAVAIDKGIKTNSLAYQKLVSSSHIIEQQHGKEDERCQREHLGSALARRMKDGL